MYRKQLLLPIKSYCRTFSTLTERDDSVADTENIVEVVDKGEDKDNIINATTVNACCLGLCNL